MSGCALGTGVSCRLLMGDAIEETLERVLGDECEIGIVPYCYTVATNGTEIPEPKCCKPSNTSD